MYPGAAHEGHVTGVPGVDCLGYLSPDPGDGFDAGDTFTIPASLQVSGNIRLWVEQRRVSWIRGVRQFRVHPAANHAGTTVAHAVA